MDYYYTTNSNVLVFYVLWISANNYGYHSYIQHGYMDNPVQNYWFSLAQVNHNLYINSHIRYTRERLYNLRRTNKLKLSPDICDKLKSLNIFKFRGTRAGKNCIRRIKTVITNRNDIVNKIIINKGRQILIILYLFST